MPALKVIRPEGLRDDYVLIKVDAPASARNDESCTVGCDYTGTVVQAGRKVSERFREGDPIAGHTHGATLVGKEVNFLDKPGVAEGAGYHNDWKRVSWSLRTL